jgi:SAM-dependent methyltransferase
MTNLSYANLFERLLGNFKGDFTRIRHAISMAPAGPLVDLGAGSGRALDAYSDREAYLVESDPQMIAILEKKVSCYRQAAILRSTALSVPLPDGFAAVVLLTANTLAEIRPALFVLAEAKRILKDNGIIHIVVANPKNLGRQPRGLRSGLKKTGHDMCYSYDLRRDPIRGNDAFIMEMRARGVT